ncbi:histidine phosphatase family protein [Chloroflexota bacterium]
MKLILVRHGETAWNVEEIFRGRIDVELNEAGIMQAQLLANYLSGSSIEAIYSSPLKRALRTAEEIAGQHGLKVDITQGFIDIDFGEWHGLQRNEVEVKYPELYREWTNCPEKVVIPGGESLDEVTDRAGDTVREITERHTGTVALVSHRVVIKVLICDLLGLDNSHFWNIRHDTCGITTFSYENGRVILHEHNNTSFLDSLQTDKLTDF